MATQVRHKVPSSGPSVTERQSTISGAVPKTKHSRGASSSGTERRPQSLKGQKKASSAGSRASHRRPASGTVTNRHQADQAGQDVRFINVPSERERSATKSHQQQDDRGDNDEQLTQISEKDILYTCQESSSDKVYDVDLHARSIGAIDNLNHFVKLRVLDLSCNFIRCIDNLDKNTDLRELKLYGNRITEVQNLEKLKELCHLQLQHNMIRSIGKGLTGLRKLKTLRLDNNHLSRIELRELAVCGQLTNIDLSNNKLDNIGALNCLQNLEELTASHNRLQSVGNLSQCKQLHEIDLSYNRLTDLSGLSKLPHLKILHLNHNELTSMNSLGKRICLEELYISYNKIKSLSWVVSLYPAIQILDISHNRLEACEDLHSLQSCKELVELSVAGNPMVDQQSSGLQYHLEFHRILPQLEVLDGVTLKRPSSRSCTPLMRPMSAASVVSSRQVEMQLTTLEGKMQDLQASLQEKFQSLRSNMESLPLHPPAQRPNARTASMGSLTPSATPSDRPVSRSGKRSRIKEAQNYAAEHAVDGYA